MLHSSRRPLDDALEKLPIRDILPEIHKGLEKHRNLVLQAETGAGKTTVVPLELLRNGCCEGRILVLQPRRIAAIGAARRMAQLWGDPLGETVGYRIRHDSMCGPHTRIEVITEGILVRMLHANRALNGVGCVFFDEFHERSLDSDMSFALSLCAQREWNAELRLVVMSATLASLGERLARLLGNCPQIFSEGRIFPVEVRHACWMEELQTQEAVRQHKLEETTAKLVSDALEAHEGDALVFLPGEKEIMYTWIYLNNNHGIGDGKVPRTMVGYGQSQVKHGMADLSKKISVMPLYGNLDQDEQDEVLAPAVPGGRKVILATPIAESSITVPGIRIVVDSGLRRMRQFVPTSNMSYMKTVQISKASADQRKGRAGRVAEGTCYRMWHEYEHKHMEDNDWPEIVKEDLANCILDLAVIGVCSDDELSSLPWLDPPPSNLVSHARDLLRRVAAVECSQEARWSLLPRGRHLARLPLHPRASHLVVQMRARFGKASVRDACNLAALLDEKDPLRGGRKEHGVDIIARYEAVHGTSKGESMLRNVTDRILNASQQMQSMLGIQLEKSHSAVLLDQRIVGLMVAWGYPELLAEKISSRVERPKGRSPLVSFRLHNGSTAKLDAFDKLARCDWLAVAAVDGEKILWACEIEPSVCAQHGLDVRNPHGHEIFDADFASDVGESWKPPPRFVRVEQIDCKERRVDPTNGKAYTFEELERICSTTYSQAEIRSYWRNECTVLSEEPQAAVVTIEPDAEPPIRTAPATLATKVSPAQLEAAPAIRTTPATLATKVAPADVGAALPTSECAPSKDERRVDPEDGRPYTFAMLKWLCSGKYSELEIEEYWATKCHPLHGTSAEHAVPGNSSLASLRSSVVGMSMEQWLTLVDDHGMLLQYRDRLVESCSTAEEVVAKYACLAPEGSTSLMPKFFEDFGVKKLGHKRIFERWFAGRGC